MKAIGSMDIDKVFESLKKVKVITEAEAIARQERADRFLLENFSESEEEK
jgi:hypothetical protein